MNSHYQHFLNATATKGTKEGTSPIKDSPTYGTSSIKDSPTYGTSSIKDSPTIAGGDSRTTTLTTTITKDDLPTPLPIKDGTTINIFNPEGTTTTKSSGEEIDVGVGGGGTGSGGGGGFGGGGAKRKKKTVLKSKIPWLLLAIAVTAGGYYYFNK